VVLLGAMGVWGAREVQAALIQEASARASATLLFLDRWLAEAQASGEEQELPGGAETGAPPLEVLSESAPSASGTRRARTPDVISVPSARVLDWVRAKKIPKGRMALASPWLPAGISIGGISRFGLGLVESDRLVRVEGAPVTDASQVISAVLSALGRGASQISGEFVRATEKGPRTIRLIVQLPSSREVEAVLEEAEKGSP
jgi:hypothetical protein